jgi:hypothetical protein
MGQPVPRLLVVQDAKIAIVVMATNANTRIFFMFFFFGRSINCFANIQSYLITNFSAIYFNYFLQEDR